MFGMLIDFNMSWAKGKCTIGQYLVILIFYYVGKESLIQPSYKYFEIRLLVTQLFACIDTCIFITETLAKFFLSLKTLCKTFRQKQF